MMHTRNAIGHCLSYEFCISKVFQLNHHPVTPSRDLCFCLVLYLSGGDDDSESDSEASVQQVRDSMSLASSHSSDDEDRDVGDWKKIPRNESKMPGRLLVKCSGSVMLELS